MTNSGEMHILLSFLIEEDERCLYQSFDFKRKLRLFDDIRKTEKKTREREREREKEREMLSSLSLSSSWVLLVLYLKLIL